MGDKPFTYEQFREIYSQVPRLCVDAVIRDRGGIVMTLRKGGYGWDNLWHLPGGTLLYREPVAAGLRRIVREEIGVEINIGPLLGYMEFFSEEKERGFGYTVSLAFLCDLVSGEPQSSRDSSQVDTFGALPENMVEEHRKFLTMHVGEIFSAQT